MTMKDLGKSILDIAIMWGILAVIGTTLIGHKYKLGDNHTARQYYFPLLINERVEKKGDDKIKYFSNAYDNRLKRVVINNRDRYNSKDTLVYPTAKEDWAVLKQEMEEIDHPNNADRVKRDLEILRR